MYWVADSEQRILGPMGLDALRELVLSGRLLDLASVSRDGRHWLPLAQVPEVLALVASRTPDAVAATQRKQAEKVREYLGRLQTMPAHEIFRVPADARVEQYRAAFFSTVKKFYPDRQPEGELRTACENVFLFLAALMVRLERAAEPARPLAAPVPPLARPVIERSSRPPLPPGATSTGSSRLRESPTYAPAEFLGLQWKDDRVQARVRVSRRHVAMFTDHPLANFAADSFFVPGSTVVPLGTVVELTLQFVDPDAEISARAKVFWENFRDPRQPTGFGLRFSVLERRDREFIKSYIGR